MIGLANTLVKHDEKYNGITGQLLGRVVVVDTIDHAIAIAKKYHHSLSMVTLEGESLRPGGSMTGGAFKNSSNLLGRNREIEDLTVQVNETAQKLKNHKMRREEILAAKSLISENMEELKEKLQQQYLLENTARLNVSRARQQKEESEDIWQGLQSESKELDRQIQEMQEELETALKELKLANQREKEIEQENQAYQEKLDEQLYLESSVGKQDKKNKCRQNRKDSLRKEKKFPAIWRIWIKKYFV